MEKNQSQLQEERINEYIKFCNTKKGKEARKEAIIAYNKSKGVVITPPKKKKVKASFSPSTIFDVIHTLTDEHHKLTLQQIKESDDRQHLRIVLHFN